MTFTLPNLPYAHDALAPHMSKETLEFHHDKHHQAYVTNGNNAIKGTEFEGKSLEEIVKGSFGKNPAVFNNAGQHYNHLHFWNWMKPKAAAASCPAGWKRRSPKTSAVSTSSRPISPPPASASSAPAGAGVGQERQARNLQDRERREPAGSRRHADSRLRRLGALLLHRLPQPPPGLSQGVLRHLVNWDYVDELYGKACVRHSGACESIELRCGIRGFPMRNCASEVCRFAAARNDDGVKFGRGGSCGCRLFSLASVLSRSLRGSLTCGKSSKPG